MKPKLYRGRDLSARRLYTAVQRGEVLALKIGWRNEPAAYVLPLEPWQAAVEERHGVPEVRKLLRTSAGPLGLSADNLRQAIALPGRVFLTLGTDSALVGEYGRKRAVAVLVPADEFWSARVEGEA